MVVTQDWRLRGLLLPDAGWQGEDGDPGGHHGWAAAGDDIDNVKEDIEAAGDDIDIVKEDIKGSQNVCLAILADLLILKLQNSPRILQKLPDCCLFSIIISITVSIIVIVIMISRSVWGAPPSQWPGPWARSRRGSSGPSWRGPIRGRYLGHVISQSEARSSIMKTDWKCVSLPALYPVIWVSIECLWLA